MRSGIARVLLVSAAALWLAGCETNGTFSGLSLPPPQQDGLEAQASATPEESAQAPAPTQNAMLGSDPKDDLSLGKKYFRDNNFGLAEQHFRRAAEQHPRDSEVWVGLAASYDRLRRFDLADRAYDQAVKVSGASIEILNNWGYSYMLRGDYKRAREKLAAAQRKAPENPYVKNNLKLLAESSRTGKAIQ